MLKFDDSDTVHAMRLLNAELTEVNRPILFWIGAGASRWAGYDGWYEIAEKMHREFSRVVREYDESRGLDLLSSAKLPALFGLCKNADLGRYRRFMSAAYQPRGRTAVYERFARSLNACNPTYVVTTNVDELLEKSLPKSQTLQRSDVERAHQLLRAKHPFLLKIHGTASAIDSFVFSEDEYAAVANDSKFLYQLKALLSSVSIVFIGYGLQDEYLIRLLEDADRSAPLLGDGPHFVVTSESDRHFHTSIKPIRYVPASHADHRDAIQIVEEISRPAGKPKRKDTSNVADDFENENTKESAHLLFDIYPPGEHQISQSVLFQAEPGGPQRNLIVGSGFDASEIENVASDAMHDIIVGLVCFDRIYAPIETIGRLNACLGDVMWRLIQDDVLRFLDWTNTQGIVYPSTNHMGRGDLGSIQRFDSNRGEIKILDIISEQLHPLKGKERIVQRLFESLASSVRRISAEEEGDIPGLVRGLLLRPSIQRLIGLSSGTPLNSIPRWQQFPVLRLAHAAKVATTTRILNLSSAKLNFGVSGLMGPAFASFAGSAISDEAAAFVVAGAFDVDLGRLAMMDREILNSVLRFRDSSEAVALRAEINRRIATNDGADAAMAVDGALRSSVPLQTLQAANRRFANFMIGGSSNSTVAMWSDQRASEQIFPRWRSRSRALLEAFIKKHNMNRAGHCPCGSGDTLRNCCEAALS